MTKLYSLRKWLPLLLLAVAVALIATPAAAQTDTPASADWYARYWNNTEQSGTPMLARNERELDYNWGAGSPDALLDADYFSARWTSPVYFEAGTYRFITTSDDGVRVWIDDEHLISNWTVHPAAQDSAVVTLAEGTHEIAVDYFEETGNALISLDWQRIDQQETGDAFVNISPTSGPVGTSVNVDAGGFPANTPATVGIGRANSEPTTSMTVNTNSQGRLQTSIALPQSALVGEPWRVLVRAGTESALSSNFTVTDAGTTTCGASYVVQPGDWLARIARRCGTSIDAIVAANPSLTTPSTIYPGQVLTLPNGVDQAMVTISPTRGQVGTLLDVTAVGFPANVPVTIGIGRANSEPTTSITDVTNDRGVVNTTLTVPATAAAGEPWVVLAQGGGESALSGTFAVTSPDDTGTTVTTDYNLRLRAGPDTTFTQLDVVPAGTTLQLLGRDINARWVQVEYRDTIGWMAAWYTTVSGSLDEVPVTSR